LLSHSSIERQNAEDLGEDVPELSFLRVLQCSAETSGSSSDQDSSDTGDGEQIVRPDAGIHE